MRKLVLISIFIFAGALINIAHAEKHHISGDKWFGCTSQEYFEKLVGYAVDGDNDAFINALAAGIYIGTCTLFEDGEAVYIEDTKIFSGLVKVRRPGETIEYWTNYEAVK
jgi:hypothetical protein